MTEPTDPTEVIVTVPLDPTATVGGIARPPRPVTVGRRRSDRWLAWTIVALLLVQGAFVVYVSWRVADLVDLVEHLQR